MRIEQVQVSRVVSVYDGDTFRVDVDIWPKLFGYHIPVRIRGIDCCERNDPDGVKRDLATRAMLQTKSLLLNAKTIYLINVSRGKYFRLIADVLIDGKDLGVHLVSLGLAERYPNY